MSLRPVKPREPPERKQIKIELAKAVPLPPATPPSNINDQKRMLKGINAT